MKEDKRPGMTKEKLRQYNSLRREIELLGSQLARVREEEEHCFVQSSEGPGYARMEVRVDGYASKERAALAKKLRRREQEALRQRDEIEDFLSSITESDIRLIVTYRYILGYSWTKVAMQVGGGNSVSAPRTRLDRYLKEKGLKL